MEVDGGVIDGTLFITGAQRSGTTLLEKLLGGQRSISLLSQPFPLLFVEAKGAFLRSVGSDTDRYPLGHLFRERRYEPSAFDAFLRGWRTSPEDLRMLFVRMEAYSGQYTKFSASVLNAALEQVSTGDDFAGVVSRLDHALAARRDARWFGSKETICEELVPYLLDRGFRCAIILRDPRDVIASLNHGRGREFGGEIKPTLFNIRSWRKSVAFARAMESHPRFHWCRYEDLVCDTSSTMARLTGALGISSVDEPLMDETWRGNSSHGELQGISTSSVGAYREVMPPLAARLIEAACLPEMQTLGYETSMTRDEAMDVLAQLTEPYDGVRPGMEEDAATAENAAAEIERLRT
jgi:hypothetical protein